MTSSNDLIVNINVWKHVIVTLQLKHLLTLDKILIALTFTLLHVTNASRAPPDIHPIIIQPAVCSQFSIVAMHDRSEQKWMKQDNLK